MKVKWNIPEWEKTSLDKKAQVDRITWIFIVVVWIGALVIFYIFTK